MSEKGNFRNNRRRFESERKHALFEDERTLRALLSAIGSSAETDAYSHNPYLVRCYSRVIAATSIDEAVFWHSEIVSELSVEIQIISRKSWSPQLKASVVAELTRRQDRHAVAVERLMRITNPLTWKP